ncbi:ArsR/SmtB family transcription factor [Actinoalloteichus hymeniacidonis]|uniref:Uncharacterized protein n=1 Tax=Actinoalloteichus hymeniacidonis TaxID=340345 RepID=A0AAC9HRW2_9PSEU|nr:winged helix-turn-helix domain-containing protein [Actinoalloteichus hymeniacidonis]AOS64076.1 hypothetical protein TL08_16380 [Actinoalloteichus hymeniacidonis]MBB5907862.1 DNA-binding transcriptional ArsR family regulator [Actinoalloteichus hymeniacidonis]
MVSTLGPVVESVFALDLFGQQRGSRAARWRRRVREQLGTGLTAVQQLNRECRAVPDLLWLLRRQEADGDHLGADHDARVAARRLAATVFIFCRAAILPYWSKMQAHLESERDVRGRMAITNGVETLLSALHPKVSWNSPVLEIASEQDHDVYLDGRGLVLSPSLFLLEKNCVFIDSEKQSGMPALIFSVQSDPHELSDPFDVWESGDRALGALVGATRAAALRALVESGTTGELSDRLGISLSGASKHATVLRKAGLIITSRNRATALHTLTPLGMALLQRSPRSSNGAEERNSPAAGQRVGATLCVPDEPV